ncbi:MAG: DUF5715 family protein [Spirochaetes bacterium]|jgi:hypothetical protein|nr:DUF5715 family protein [Spirochaetota bacterium]
MTASIFTRGKKAIIAGVLIPATLMSAIIAYLVINTKIQLRSYIAVLKKTERMFITSLPVYEDYATPEKEKKLRIYLLESHLKSIRDRKLPQIKTEKEKNAMSDEGTLMKLRSGNDKLYFFYNVREENRYLTPRATKCLNAIGQRFNINIKKKGDLPNVKFAVSSALRTVEYQESLKKKNNNATSSSSHTYGTSFDIFYDEYMVVIPGGETCNPALKSATEEMDKYLGYMMGSSLRRQFHSMMMETLLEMQDEGLVYVTLENNQRCFHVTVL